MPESLSAIAYARWMAEYMATTARFSTPHIQFEALLMLTATTSMEMGVTEGQIRKRIRQLRANVRTAQIVAEKRRQSIVVPNSLATVN